MSEGKFQSRIFISLVATIHFIQVYHERARKKRKREEGRERFKACSLMRKTCD